MQNELDRLQAVNRFLTLKVDKDLQLQEIVELASEICETPVALITLMDENTQYFEFKVGTEYTHNTKKDSFCQYLIGADDLVVVPDAALDSRFADNPLVANHPNIRFYAGAALNTHDGYTIGSLCVLDLKPRELTHSQKHLLKVCARQVTQIMELEFSLHILKQQFEHAKETEQKLRSFFESSGTYHLFIGKNKEVIAYNKKMSDFLFHVYNVRLFAGMHINQMLTGIALKRFSTEFNTAINGQELEYEQKINFGDKTMWWCVSILPTYNPEGTVIGVSYNTEDITERKAHEQQILAQNESLKNIAHIQSHEFRRPVASILGFMELFKTNNYRCTKKELLLMEKATRELDDKIRTIVEITGEA